MLEKLFANLPFKPEAAHELWFYTRRLHGEQSIRRLGLIFIVLTFFVQFFAFISPPQHTMARSNNDIIDGGFTTPSEAVSFCKSDINNFHSILSYYGISCNDLARSHSVSLKSTDYNKQLFSMGRLPYGKKGETPVSINGKTYYLRYLWSWDTGPYSSYQALKGTSSVTGKTFFILFRCGNLTFIGLPSPPQRCIWNNSLLASDLSCRAPLCPLDSSINADSPRCQSCPYNSSILKSNSQCVECPYTNLNGILRSDRRCQAPCPFDSSLAATSAGCKPCSTSQTRDDKTACLELSKTASNLTEHIADANGTTAQAGDEIAYTLTVKNTGKATVRQFVIQENVSDVLDYSDIVQTYGGTVARGNIVSWPAVDIPTGQSVKRQLNVKIKTTIPTMPASLSDPDHYDNTLTNVYGNTVSIKLPNTPVKTTEQIVSTLPKTGPGASLTISFAITMLAGYLFARTRLLGREARLGLEQYKHMGVSS